MTRRQIDEDAMEVPGDPWLLLRRKFSVAAAIDGSACFNATGCKAICNLMDEIAAEIGQLRAEVAALRARAEGETP